MSHFNLTRLTYFHMLDHGKEIKIDPPDHYLANPRSTVVLIANGGILTPIMGLDKKRTRRIVFWVLVIILILLLVVAYLRYLDLKKKFISTASERATSLIGQRVHIKDLSVSSAAAINLYGVTVENPEGFLPGRLLQIKSVRLNMGLTGLLKGKFSFRSIVLHSPELTLMKDEKGKWNISEALGRFLSEKSEAEYNYEVDEFRIESGIFDFNKDKRYRNDRIDLLLRNLSSRPGIKTEGKGTFIYAGNKVEMKGWAYLKNMPKSVNVSISSNEFTLPPFIISLPKTRMSIELHAEGNLEKGFHIQSDIRTKRAGFPPFAKDLQDIRLTADAIFSLHDDSLAIRKASLYADGSSVASIKGLLSDLKKRPSYRIGVRIEKLDLSRLHFSGDLKLNGILASNNLFVTGDFESKGPKVWGSFEWRDGGIESRDLIIKNVTADAMVSSGQEISVRGQASVSVLKAGRVFFEKPVDARLSALLRTIQKRLVATSLINLSPVEMKMQGGETIHFDSGSVTLDGAIEGGGFSGKNTFDIKSIRYAGHILDGVKGGSSIHYRNENFDVKNLTIETKAAKLSANQVTISLPGIKSVYILDIRGMNAAYRDREALLRESDLYLVLRLAGKSLSGDLRFTAGTILFKGIAAGNLSATSKFDEKNFYVDISRADVSGGRVTLTARGSMSEGLFPITTNLVAEDINLERLSESVLKLLNLRYHMAGDIKRATFDGTINSRELLYGHALLQATNISILNPGTSRNIVKDASFNSEIEFNGKDLLIRAEASVGTLSSQLSATLTEFMGKERHLKAKGTLPDAKLTDIRNSLWDIFPDSLLYAKLDGSISSDLSMDYSGDGLEVKGSLTVRKGILGGENGEYALGPIDGTLPIRYGKVGKKQEPLSLPSFQKSQFDSLQKFYMQGVGEQGSYRVTMGSLTFGFQFFDNIELRMKDDSRLFNVERFSADIFEGRLSGSAIIDISDGLNYRVGFLVKGLSLKKLCDGIQPVKGFISGKVDGIGTFKGSGVGISALIGKADFWTYPTKNERTVISKEFLQKVGGTSMKVYLRDRPFDRGTMTLYLQNGDLTFEELELSNRNFLGMTDLSIKVAPLNNRIALDNFLWTITEAAERAKKKK